MAELIFFAAILSPFVLMVWLTMARRKAQATVAARQPESEVDFETVEELETDAQGHVAARRHLAQSSLEEPDPTGGEIAGVRAMQGRNVTPAR